MAVTSDTGFTWADRAAQRGVAFSFASNTVLTALAWPAMSAYYDARVLLPSAALMFVGGMWFAVQTLLMRFRRRDFLWVSGLLVVTLTAMALAPTTGPAPAGWSWTQGWAVTAVCGAVLLLARRAAVPVVALITLLELWVRSKHVPVGVAVVEAVVPVAGALVVAWASRSATARFEQAAAALRLANRAEEEAATAQARAEAQTWWNRILHDKVLGALLLTSRATSPNLLAQAREVAQDALETLSRIRDVRSESGDAPLVAEVGVGLEEPGRSDGSAEGIPVDGLQAGLTRLAAKHGLVADLKVRGREGTSPSTVRGAVLAAADQALRNVAQHSGQSAVWIHAVRSPTKVRVDIRDQGVGFDTSKVHERRLGLRSSIPGHMALVDGSATVTSEVGRGTSVVLAWSAADKNERGASVTQAQLRSWWWISASYAGLHLLAGWLSGGPLAFGRPWWVGLVLIVSGYVVLHTLSGPRLKVLALVLVLTGCTLMLWQAPHSVAQGWDLWFLGASYPALLIPALRGRPWLSVGAGVTLAAIIMLEFALTPPASLLDAGQLALPFIVIPVVGALYAVMVARADGRLHEAQEAEALARRQLHEVEARQRLVNSQLTMLAPGTLTLLERLVAGELITAADRSAARLMEAGNRDHLVAPDVLDATVVDVLAAARSRGVTVHLTSASASLVEESDMARSRLEEFRARLILLANRSMGGDEVTARWQPTNSFASGTLTLSSESVDAEAYETIPAL